jgi:valyl-tRNA synthetase
MSETDDGPLGKSYDARETESRWYAQWERAGIFTPSADDVVSGKKKPYVIMMPPPNVTGTLHNGHALFITLQDVLTRYHRMKGDAALWLPGVDHAGIATQAVVERELMRHEKKTRRDLGREAFLERVWAWKEKNGSRIVEQCKVMGASADWTRERFTMDEMCNVAVKEAFVRLWNEGLIYRGERLVNWDPATKTALSDEEVEHEEKDGELWRFAYAVKGGGEIVVATTRPETMLGDTGVAVHPDDERYAAFVGKELVHPFFPTRKVVVFADAGVDKEFGTGAVKVTPAHDPNDFEMGKRHGLAFINILNLDATINDAGGAYRGLDRYEARKRVKADLEAQGFFRGTEAIKHAVSVSQRSGAVVEPMLSRQYFVRAKPLAEQALAAVDSGETKIIPASWRKTYDHFMLNIRDWCISRQLWWGHRIPVFYDLTKIDEAIEADANRKGGETAGTRAQARGLLGKELLAVALDSCDDEAVAYFSTASTEPLDPSRYVQEEDVLDTWFSSGLWPFSTLGWPNQTKDLQAFYPGAVLETGFDILFFWVARMMMLGCWFMKKPPFADVFLHAMVRDAHGQKMSKSLGNAIDPLDVVYGITLDELLAKTKTYPIPEKNIPRVLKALEKDFPEGIPASGADGLRFTLAALAGQGRDVKLSIPRVAGYRAFLNKIWNASRFALMRVGDRPLEPLRKGSLADRWILSRLQAATEKCAAAIDGYRFDEYANVVYQFFWTELCDAYIEMSKDVLAGPPSAAQEATRTTLVHALDASMRLLHPACPFQSEEIWQKLPGRALRWPDVAFCAVAPWPQKDASLVDEDAEKAIALVLSTTTMVRNVRQESGLSPRLAVDVDVVARDPAAAKILAPHLDVAARLASATMTMHDAASYQAPKLSAVHSDGRIEVVVKLAGLIDETKEKARLQREIEKAEKERLGLDKRMANADFVAKAPPEVVVELRANIAALTDKIARLKGALGRL